MSIRNHYEKEKTQEDSLYCGNTAPSSVSADSVSQPLSGWWTLKASPGTGWKKRSSVASLGCECFLMVSHDVWLIRAERVSEETENPSPAELKLSHSPDYNMAPV